MELSLLYVAAAEGSVGRMPKKLLPPNTWFDYLKRHGKRLPPLKKEKEVNV